MDKNVTDTTLSSNYGDILMSALDHAKDQFTDEEYAALKADADKIREIETQIAALPQDEAASQSMTQTASTFPQFEGKDLDGNSVSSSLLPIMRSPLLISGSAAASPVWTRWTTLTH
ncbi:hypothetical protein NIA69_01845 [Gemmiger formicilis]|nr:hypothetical protein [Gemmiger formicilis]